MKKFTVIYFVMFALTVAIPAAVCFISKNEDNDSIVNIFHSASAVIDGLTVLK